MDGEDPKQHDFDQRHDGPFEQPHPSVSFAARRQSESALRRSGEYGRGDAYANFSPVGRKSVQIGRSTPHEDFNTPPRATTNLSQSARPSSRDFNQRRDGPYGRPSLTMERRRSSGKIIPTSPEQRRPTLPTMADEQEKEQHQEVALADAQQSTEPAEEPSMETLQSDVAFEPEPPSLNYSLQPRKRSIIIFWGLIIIDCIFMPVGLYFGLWYGTNLSPNIVFSIVTAALGGISIFEYILRFWRLWKKASTCRVIGARRAYLDWFHWNFSLGWMIIMIELIIGTIPENPPIRLLAMPVTSMLYVFGTELIIVDVLRLFQVPAPWRMSSIPRHAQLRPAIYTFIEDVCAVDGSGGTAYREALNRRYEASHIFRAMLRRLGLFWAVGAEGIAILCTILIFTIQHEAAYVVGWALPFIWASIWALATTWYVKRKLREEKKAWADEIAAKSAA